MEKIIMPKAGMAMEEGTIIQWLKEVGDHVEYGEPLLEIETDKTSMKVEALASGYLLQKIYDAGDTVPVVTTIGWLGEKNEVPPAAAKEAGSGSSVSAAAPPIPVPVSDARHYDLVVLGGGPAGYTAAIRAAQAGKKTAIIEQTALGGTCLNRGCIPTKTYLHTSEILESLSELKDRGICLKSNEFSVDMPKAVDQKNAVVGRLVSGLNGLMRAYGIDVYPQKGEIGKDHEVVLEDGTVLGAESVIFAGGSQASRINIPGIDLPFVVTSDELLDIQKCPRRLVVIGGGVIGVELGSVFAALGSEVTILEAMNQILPNVDPEISAILRRALEARGMRIQTGVGVQSISGQGEEACVQLSDGTQVHGDTVLLSIGRRADLSGLGQSGVRTEKGRVPVDAFMRTNVPWIYAPGDVNGQCMLAHAAEHMAENAVRNALGEAVPYDGRVVPACIYTKPEVACVGMSEDQAKKEGRTIAVGRFPFTANGRALASDAGTGLVKTVVEPKTGEILGVHIAGPDAAEMINQASILMAMEITAWEVPQIVWAHPTFSEALKGSLEDALGKCPELPPHR